MTLKNDRAPLLYYTKLSASFQSHRGIKTLVTVRNRSIRVKICNFLSRVTLKLDGLPWKTIGYLFFTTYPLLYYVKICASFQIHCNQTGVTVRKRSIRVKISDFFVPCDLEIWWMTLKNNRTPLLCCFKLCASFHSYQWIQAGVTVRKRSIWVKIGVFCHVWPWNLMDDLEKQ